MEIFDLDWKLLWDHLIQLGIAFILAFPIGWEQQRGARSPGIRTFPLVAIGSCGFMLIGLDAFQGDEANARVVYGIITGIGFIGGGAIVKSGTNIRGTSTAASLWNTGAIGIAVAWKSYEIAILISLINLVTFLVLTPLSDGTGKGKKKSSDTEASESSSS